MYTARDLPTIQLTGVRIDVPLYYAPLDASVLGAYPGIKFSFTDCRPQAPSVNLTIERIQVSTVPKCVAPRHALSCVPSSILTSLFWASPFIRLAHHVTDPEFLVRVARWGQPKDARLISKF